MKSLVIALITLFSASSFACLSGAEFYSVVKPAQLNMLSNEPQKLVVGDILRLRENMQVVEGDDKLQELGFIAGSGGAVEMYYLVKAEGRVVLGSKTDEKAKTVTYEAKQPPRTRGGCGDYRNPASESPAKKK